MSIDLSSLALGQVVTGFSFPVVALYNASGGTVTYSGGMDLARGVSLDPDIETADEDNVFYANNRSSESVPRRFKRGTVGVTVDGLLVAAEKLLMGIPASATSDVTIGSGQSAPTVAVTDYNDDQDIPYVGFGVVVRSQSNGVELYRAVVYTKCRFEQFDVPAATQEEDIDWQTTELNAALHRDDTAKHTWLRKSEFLETELEAYNAVRVMLGMSVAAALPTP